MAVGYNPRIVTDGLVLCLDAGNTKNYNAGISTNWTDKVGGNNGTLVGGTHHNDGPFVGAGYVEFDGTGDYLSIADSADFDFGTGDFTLEFWVYIKTSGQTDVLFVKRNSNAVYAPFMFILLNGDLQARYSTTGSSWSTTTIKTNANISTNTWHHVVMVRSGSSFTGFYDGQSVAMTSSSSSLTSNTDDLVIGGDKNTNYFDGYISNLRVLKGTALYTSDFTPPSSPLTAVTNTKLLTCQGNSISDASSSGHTITVNGDATANLGFPASAFEFDGVDDYVDCGNNSILDVGNNITVNVWFYVNQTASFETIIAKVANDYSLGWELDNNSGAFRVTLRPSATQIDLTAGSLSVGNWYMGTMTFDNTTARLYLNGVQTGSTTSGGPVTLNSTQSLTIGRRVQGNYYDGNIAQVSIYNKALTASEVTQNYNAHRGRYGI